MVLFPHRGDHLDVVDCADAADALVQLRWAARARCARDAPRLAAEALGYADGPWNTSFRVSVLRSECGAGRGTQPIQVRTASACASQPRKRGAPLRSCLAPLRPYGCLPPA